MFFSSFIFELKYRLKSPGTWICLLALTVMAYREMLTGEWDLLIQSGRVARNSPYTVYYLFMYYTFWAATIGSALVIPTLLRDLKSGTAEMLYSFPINSKQYFIGKYLAVLLIFILVMSSVAIGFITLPFVATSLGIHPASEFIATPWRHIGHAFILWVLPACFIYGSLVYALTAMTGRAAPAYGLMMLAIGLFVMITALYGDGAPKSTLVQILDPLGKVTVEGQIYYWTAEERMSRFLTFEGALLQNRLLYMGFAALVLIIAWLNFDIRQLLQRTRGRNASLANKKNPDITNSDYQLENDKSSKTASTTVTSSAGQLYWLAYALHYGVQLFFTVVKNKAFYLSMLTLIFMLILAGFSYMPIEFEGSGKLLPKAFVLMPGLLYPSLIFTLIAAAFFSIELCDRENTFRINQLVSACPIPSWSLMLAKLFGIILMALPLAFIPAVSVLCIQYGQGYFDTNWSVLAHITLLVLLPVMLAYVMISLICYAVLQNKALAQAVAIILCVTPAIFNEVKTVENFMALWAWPFFVQLSDFDASEQYFQRHLSFAVYWLSLYAALAVIAYWLWPRVTIASLRQRLHEARSRLGPISITLMVLFSANFIYSMKTIHADMIVRNHYQSSNQKQAEQADYEKRYGHTRTDAQPKIVRADLTVDLYPTERRAAYSADLTVTNKTNDSIKKLVLNYADFSHITDLSYQQQPLKPQHIDKQHRRLSYALPTPLLPGNSAKLNISLAVAYHGFSNEEFDYHGSIVSDGSYFGHNLWPSFGYDRQRELQLVGLRHQLGLAARQAGNTLSTATSITDFAQGDDADFIQSRIRISTEPDQIALATGERSDSKESTAPDLRKTYYYVSQQPTLWNIHLVSGRYQQTSAVWQSADGLQSVTIEYYFHPNHNDNIDHFIAAAKQALTAGYQQWGRFPYQSLRFAETPNGLSDSHISGNLIIIPETHGWIHDYRKPPLTDWIRFQVVRDVSQIWWQQLALANVNGQPLLSHAIATLQGLQAIASTHGNAAAIAFIDQIADNYLRQRVTEDSEEAIITELDDENYANTKASLALYSAYQWLGGKRFNKTLRHFFTEHHQNRTPPYSHADDLIKKLLSAAHENNSHSQIQRLFKSTHYYDFRVEDAQMTHEDSGNYQLKVQFSATQYRHHSGSDHEFAYRGPVDVQIMGGDDATTLLYKGNLQFQSALAELQLSLKEQPRKIIVNPKRKLLERSPNDNVLTF